MRLRILHTNDLHSRFENFASVVTKIKELDDENTIILDAGDFNDFMRLELQGTNGEAGCKLLNMAGYDAIAIGNNEGFSKIDTIENMTSKKLVTFLSCNLYKSGLEPINGVKRSIILERGGLRVLVVGCTPPFNEFFVLDNMYATNPYEEIQKEIDANKDRYDICVVLSHEGIREDRQLPLHVKGADIIIGGHSHTLMEDAETVNNVIIHQSGCYGEYLGVVDIEFDNGEIKGCSVQNIKIEGVLQDEAVLTEISAQKELAVENLSSPLYSIDKDVWHDVCEENPMSNLLADALKDVLKCDIGIINSGVINGGIRKGYVTKKKLLEVCPSPLNPTYMEIKGENIRAALEQSLNSDVCMQDGKGAGFRGKYLGRLHVSGMEIVHNGKKVLSIKVNGSELDDQKIYSTATSDYLQRGTGYKTLADNSNEKYNPEYLRDTIGEYLQKKDYVNNSFKDRWIRVYK